MRPMPKLFLLCWSTNKNHTIAILFDKKNPHNESSKFSLGKLSQCLADYINQCLDVKKTVHRELSYHVCFIKEVASLI